MIFCKKSAYSTHRFVVAFVSGVTWVLWSPFKQMWEGALEFWFDVEREIRGLFR